MEKLSWREQAKRLATTANIATAVIAVGVALAARFVLPWPAAKFLVALAAVVLITALAGVAYRRYVIPDVEEPTATDEKQEAA